MYLEHFRLKEMPFKITPEPRFLYLTVPHQQAIGKCLLTVNEHSGLCVVYGSVGMGKTTIARHLYSELRNREDVIPAELITPSLKTENALLKAILDEFKVEAGRSYAASLTKFYQYMAEAHQKNKNLVVIIDEAQKLTPRMLDLVHSLLNFESDTDKFLQIILIGQQELADHIERVPAIESRVARFARLTKLTRADSDEMIAFRWHTASGGKSSHPFNDEALKAIYEYSKGLPRSVSKFCHESLLVAFDVGSKEVTLDMIKEVLPTVKISAKED